MLSLPAFLPPTCIHTKFSYCDYYTHSTCSAFIDNSVMVFINGTSVNGDVEVLQQQVTKLIRQINRHTNRSTVDPVLREKCRRLAKSVACHAKFPYCHPEMDTPTPRPVCRSTCDSFAPGGLCSEFLNEQTSPELYSKVTFNCDSRHLPGGTRPECIPISTETAETGEPT